MPPLKTKMHEIAEIGQSLWVDNISRSMITSGRLKSLIDQGLRGQTSNPTIFKQAITSSSDYDARILELAEAGNGRLGSLDVQVQGARARLLCRNVPVLHGEVRGQGMDTNGEPRCQKGKNQRRRDRLMEAPRLRTNSVHA